MQVMPEGNIMCVPTGVPEKGNPDIRTRILMEYHDGHLNGQRGISNTYLSVRRRFKWPSLSKDVESSCHLVKYAKQAKVEIAKRRKCSATTDPLVAWNTLLV